MFGRDRRGGDPGHSLPLETARPMIDPSSHEPQAGTEGLLLDHVGVATESIRASAASFQLLSGASCSQVEEVPGQKVRVAFVGTVELLEPTDPEGPVGRFLQRRGPGLHHIAYGVADIEAKLEELRSRQVPLVDEDPRTGAGGHRVAFLHPRAAGGVLVELVERPISSPHR